MTISFRHALLTCEYVVRVPYELFVLMGISDSITTSNFSLLGYSKRLYERLRLKVLY